MTYLTDMSLNAQDDTWTYAPALDVLLVRRDADAPGGLDNSQGAALPDATRGCDKMPDSRGQRTTCPEKQSTNPGEFHAIYDLMEGLIGASRAATVGGRETRVQSEPPEDYCERLWSMEREATGKR